MKNILSFDDIPKESPLYIYGTGVAGRKIFSYLNSMKPGIVSGFIDSYHSGEIEGVSILDPFNDNEKIKDGSVLIASQSWMEIKGRLENLGIFKIFNAYEFYKKLVNSKEKFILGSNNVDYKNQLIDIISNYPDGKRFAVVGCDQSALKIYSILKDDFSQKKNFKHYDTGFYEDGGNQSTIESISNDNNSEEFSAIILEVPAADIKSVLRRLRTVQRIDAPIWLSKECIDRMGLSKPIGTLLSPHVVEIREELTEKHGRPLVVVVPPCAGTMRFLPQIENLLNLVGWSPKPFMPLTYNPFFFSQFRENNHSEIKVSDIYSQENTNQYYYFAKSLNYYEYNVLHDHSISLAKFRDIPFKMIVLMRDPRDIINSLFYRNYRFDRKKRSIEEFMLDLLDGEDFFFSPEYGYRWASAKEWTDSYLAAMESPNMEVVRFEELHRDEVGTLRDVLSRLELYPNPFVDITEDSLRMAAHLGSFEHQTNGQASRGEDRQWIVGQTSCRKGVVGDWRSTFTPAVVEKFKILTGDALIRLGYEGSMDWENDRPEAV